MHFAPASSHARGGARRAGPHADLPRTVRIEVEERERGAARRDGEPHDEFVALRGEEARLHAIAEHGERVVLRADELAQEMIR